ncbi:hypothetical protein RND71_036389 [Anisodus tanguticus]|uniref:Leucine-rich repeat-containing N-terminal plant-type domain-containing protein n=1 Tax=Anisodus tanguticus TaxID=243964 RepID=A0AAE1R0V7_9SOLA|nr:hypothetical protein RND71_036389 [Anisodus tanguticus]
MNTQSSPFCSNVCLLTILNLFMLQSFHSILVAIFLFSTLKATTKGHFNYIDPSQLSNYKYVWVVIIDFVRNILLFGEKKMAILFFFYSLFCFSFLSQSFSSSSVHHLCSPDEASALLHFKQHFEIYDEEKWLYFNTSFPKTTSWNESRDCCSWDGVTCHLLTGHVIGLDLRCSQLGGSIHPNSSLFQLHHLQTLYLDSNNLNGHIPDSIGNLTQLTWLDFSDNHFTGHIPDSIGNLTQLRELYFSGNHFTGHIPDFIGNHYFWRIRHTTLDIFEES